ncbi:porin [Rhodobacterales bacterium]|nr:porin [Rhodobacterales bacterium]
MKFKSMMLGAAAAAAAATTAQAADLPVAPEPVDYVRICDAYGSTFYYIPGTETCLKVGGRIRTQFVVNNVLEDGAWGTRDADGYTWRTQAYAYLDARTATQFGTLRAYSALSQRAENGVLSVQLDKAYIQWGGMTAGYATSNFDIFTGQTFMGVVTRNWSDQTVNQLAYTAAFGNGFSATLAVEDRSAREVGAYGGTRMPDFVAALAVSQGWGSAQLSGALHQVYPDTASSYQTGITLDGAEDDLGFAVGGGVVFNLPMITPGSNIFFQGFYADGALSYLGASGTVGGVTVSDFGSNGDTSTGYSLSAGAYIQATSTIGLALDGSFMDLDQAEGFDDFNRYAVDGSVVWQPVSGLEIGADVGYANTQADGEDDVDELLFGVRMQRTF